MDCTSAWGVFRLGFNTTFFTFVVGNFCIIIMFRHNIRYDVRMFIGFRISRGVPIRICIARLLVVEGGGIRICSLIRILRSFSRVWGANDVHFYLPELRESGLLSIRLAFSFRQRPERRLSGASRVAHSITTHGSSYRNRGGWWCPTASP